MLVPWLQKRGDGVFFSPSVCILSRVVCSHASHVIPAPLPPARQADVSHIWPQYLPDLSRLAHGALKRCLTMSALVMQTPFFKYFPDMVKSQFESVYRNVDIVMLCWRLKFLEVEYCAAMRKRRFVLFTVSMEVPALPARLWPEGSEILKASLTVSRERDEFGALCLLVVFLPQCLLC